MSHYIHDDKLKELELKAVQARELLIEMPKMDGMTVMQKLREDNWGKKVPVILLTSLESDEKIMKGIIRDEPTFYLVKSEFSLENLVYKVKESLGITTVPEQE